MNFLYWVCWGIVYIPVRLFFPTVVKNKPALHFSGKAIYVCNHMSNLDILVIKSHEHRKRKVLAKHTLFKNKALGGFFRFLGGVPINRDNVELSSIKEVLLLLKKGEQITIFPEGTRHGDISAENGVKSGVGMFALKSGAPIIPMAMLYKPKLFRPNKILVGQPLDLSKFEGVRAGKEEYSEVGDMVLKAIVGLRKNYIESFSYKKQLKIYRKLKRQAG